MDDSLRNPPKQEMAFTLVTKLKVNVPQTAKYLDWLTRLMMEGVESSGILSAEISPPCSCGTTEWTLIQRFATKHEMQAWLASDSHLQLMQELKDYLDRQEVVISESTDPTFAAGGSVSVAVVTRVKQGQEQAYFDYEKKYQLAQAQSPGFRGTYVQPPTKMTPGIWTTIFRFDSPQAMDRWFASEKRLKLLHESDPVVRSTDFHNVTTSFPGWFPADEASAGQGPPNWKAALLILLGLYPSVMLVIIYVLPVLQGSMAVKNFIGNILTVAFTTWISMPFFIMVYKSWLFPKANTPQWAAPVSLLSIFVLLALEVAFFWRFF